MDKATFLKKVQELGFPVKIQGDQALAQRNEEPTKEVLITQKPKTK